MDGIFSIPDRAEDTCKHKTCKDGRSMLGIQADQLFFLTMISRYEDDFLLFIHERIFDSCTSAQICCV